MEPAFNPTAPRLPMNEPTDTQAMDETGVFMRAILVPSTATPAMMTQIPAIFSGFMDS